MVKLSHLHQMVMLTLTPMELVIFYWETKSDSEGKGFSAKLWSIDLTGYNERLVDTKTDASDPSWSSLLSE